MLVQVVRARSVVDRLEVAQMRDDSEANRGPEMAAEVAAGVNEAEYRLVVGKTRIPPPHCIQAAGHIARTSPVGNHLRTEGSSLEVAVLRTGLVARLRQVCLARQAVLAADSEGSGLVQR